MTTISFNYAAPESLGEAVALLKKEKEARVLAGGHSLLTEIKLRRLLPSMLVDLRKITALNGIEPQDDGSLRIGAMTTFREIAGDQGIRENYLALNEAVNSTPDALVRNRSTIGGNLAQNNIGSDLPAAAMVLDATVNIFSSQGFRTLSADELCTKKAVLAKDEIITSLDFPATSPDTVSVYEKFINRAKNYATCGVAVSATLTPDNIVRKCRVAVTGATEHAIRLPEIENLLSGKSLSVEAIAGADWAGYTQQFISDLSASAEYRTHLVKVLTEHSITRILAIHGTR
jgi:carbon-monoxide dehydrogenase medium subunit